MFVAVAILAMPAAWLNWQMGIVRERRTLLSELDAASNDRFNQYNTVCIVQSDGTVRYERPMRADRGISWFRELLGDSAYSCLILPPTITDDDLMRFRRAFPEATIDRIQSKAATAAYSRSP